MATSSFRYSKLEARSSTECNYLYFERTWPHFIFVERGWSSKEIQGKRCHLFVLSVIACIQHSQYKEIFVYRFFSVTHIYVIVLISKRKSYLASIFAGYC